MASFPGQRAGSTPTAPTTPSNLVATALLTGTQIQLTWNPSQDGDLVLAYVIQRCSGVACINFSVITTTQNGAISFLDTNLTPSTSYSYIVQAVDGSGNLSGLSNIATATTSALPTSIFVPHSQVLFGGWDKEIWLPATIKKSAGILASVVDTIPPTVPGSFTATTISSSEIDLSWTSSIDTGSGVALYTITRNPGSLIIQVGSAVVSYKDNGLNPSTTYSYTISATDHAGNTSANASASATTSASTVSSFAPNFPRTGFTGIGTTTDDYYNNVTVTVQRLGSIPIQTAYGSYNIFVLGADFEGWNNNNTRDMQVLVTNIKSTSTAPLGVKLFRYGKQDNYLPGDTSLQTWQNGVTPQTNWTLYNNALATPLVATPAGGGNVFVNYAEDSVGNPFGGRNSAGESPAQWSAHYQFYAKLNKNRTGADASRFTGVSPFDAAPSLDGVLLDNMFVDPRVNSDWMCNGTQSTKDNGSYQGVWSDILIRGQKDFCDTLSSLISAAGQSQWLAGNAGDYSRADIGNNQTTAGVMWGVMNASFWETAIGKSFALETFGSFQSMLSCYYQLLDFLKDPHVGMLNMCLPDGTPAQSGNLPWSATQTAVNGEFQWARYMIASALLGDGYCFIQHQTAGYSANGSQLTWYDEYDNGGVQKGYLGQAIDARQTNIRTWYDGTTTPNVYAREFQNGLAIVVAKTGVGQTTQPTGTITITGAQLGIGAGRAWNFISGTQAPAINKGGAVTSAGVTLQASRDGIILLKANPNVDQSWSAIVTGSAKSAKAGFIAFVKNVNGAETQGGMISVMSSPGPIDIYFERVLGETGAISATITTFNSTNCVAGTNYTAVNQTLTWADGEIGWKKITIQVTSIPTGLGLVGISVTGAAYRPTGWLWLQGTGLVPGAKFFQSSNGVNVNGNVSGSGTAASPWLGLSHAISTMGAAGGVLYWIQNGTNGHMEWGGTGGTSQGVVVNGFSATNSNPLIILPHPSNTVQAFMDQGCTAGGANILWSNAPALYFKGTGAGLWLCGIHFYRGGIQWNGQDVVQWSNVVLWQCEIDNYAVNLGSNVHCVRFEHVVNAIFQDCYVHNSYTNETFSANSYDTLASGNEACFGTLRPSFCSVVHCFMKRGQYALMNKQGPDTGTDTPCEITHCLAMQCQASTTSGGALTGYPVQGNGWQNGLIRYCVYDGSSDVGPTSGGLLVQFDTVPQCANLDIISSVSITGTNGGGGFGLLNDTTGWRILNSISQDSTSANNEIKIHTPDAGETTQLLLSDFNMYVRGSHTWTYNYGGTSTSVTSLAAWQATAPNSFLANFNDTHSISTSTTPSYNNISLKDYRINNSGGRGNRPIGVGAERVGIVNNFLNTSLPKAPQ